jgi:hypothetical protein
VIAAKGFDTGDAILRAGIRHQVGSTVKRLLREGAIENASAVRMGKWVSRFENAWKPELAGVLQVRVQLELQREHADHQLSSEVPVLYADLHSPPESAVAVVPLACSGRGFQSSWFQLPDGRIERLVLYPSKLAICGYNSYFDWPSAKSG